MKWKEFFAVSIVNKCLGIHVRVNIKYLKNLKSTLKDNS